MLLTGVLLLYAARRPAVRLLVLVIAILSKLIFLALVLTLGQSYMGSAGLAVVADSVMVLQFSICLGDGAKSDW